ncbi:MAG: hypothetical protein HKN08_07110 [Gammaproteobacteria bacterium]|nr:hypothetical protein [Gammaproteobacteria bacterium]
MLTNNTPSTPNENKRFQHYLLFTFLILSTAIFYYSYTSNDLAAGFTSDDAIYLLLADLYSFSTTGTNLFYFKLSAESHFPPVYPMIMGLFGGDSTTINMASTITVTMLILSILIYFRWIYTLTSSLHWTLMSGLLLILLPANLIFAQELWSEFLFMIFLYGALLLNVNSTLTQKYLLSSSLLVAIASLTRSIGIALIIAFIIFIIIRRTRHAIRYTLVCLVPFLIWNFTRDTNSSREGYIQIFADTLTSVSLDNILDTSIDKIATFYDSFLWLFSSIDTGHVHASFVNISVTATLVLVVIGFVARIKRLEMDALFLVTYLAIIFVWPFDNVYFVSRFLYPLIPLFLYYSYLGISGIFHDQTWHTRTQVLFIAALFISILPSSTQYISRGYSDVQQDLSPFRRDRQWLMADTKTYGLGAIQNSKFIITSLQKVRGLIPEHECIFAIQAPIVMLYTKRITGILPPPQTSNEEFRNQFRECKYSLAMPVIDSQGIYPEFYPLQRLSADEYQITARFLDQHSEAEILLVKH